MKLSDFLLNIGRPVAFYPGLAKALGGIKPAVFVCQMAYWKDKGDNSEGWIYKTSDEIEGETALTYKEQTAVRSLLVTHKILEERYARTEHKMYFRINWNELNQAWDEHITNGKVLEHPTKSKMPPSRKSDTTLPKVSSLNSNTENTHKTTQKNTESAPKANSFPSNVLFREVTERYPAKANWHTVLRFMFQVEKRLGHAPTKDDLFPFYEAWCGMGWRPDSIHWLEYAVKGELPRSGKAAQEGFTTKVAKFIDPVTKFLQAHEQELSNG